MKPLGVALSGAGGVGGDDGSNLLNIQKKAIGNCHIVTMNPYTMNKS
jgi:hypothetical protein